MLAEAKNSDLLPAWHEYIGSEQVRDAFCYLVGLAAVARDFSCYATRKGDVRDFRFYSSGREMPYAFIPAKDWLLFYFRLPAVRSAQFDATTLQTLFSDASCNPTGEWTVRLRTIGDVQRLWRHIESTGGRLEV
jgi:hypothetical protein